MSSMLAFFLVCFHCSASSSHSPASCRISLAQVGLGLAISRGGPLCCGLPLSARPGPPGPLGAVLSQAGSPLRGRGPQRARALGRSAPLRPAGDGASSGTLEPVVGRPRRPLSERSFPSATFTRAAIQPANTAQSSRGRHHWQQQSRCFGDLGKPAPAEDWTCSILGGRLAQRG